MTEILTSDQALAKLQALPRPWTGQYLAMYSSLWQGIITEPWLMVLPLDDHMAHRGDGVFEAVKCVNGGIYQLERHLERLFLSARAVYLQAPVNLEQLRELALEVVRAGGQADCLLRIYLSRGPGSLNANPAESVAPQIYMVACASHAPAAEKYERGVKAGFVRMPMKPAFYANVKSCSYLPNVLVKFHANRQGWDYPLWTNEEGLVSEGATENFALLDEQNQLIFPDSQYMVDGITMRRVRELSEQLPAQGMIKKIIHRAVREEDVRRARELMIISTSLDVLPVTSLEEQALSGGRPGPVSRELLRLMRSDIASGQMSLRVWP